MPVIGTCSSGPHMKICGRDKSEKGPELIFSPA